MKCHVAGAHLLVGGGRRRRQGCAALWATRHVHAARIFGVCDVEQKVLVTAAEDGALQAWAYAPFSTTLLSDVFVPGSGCMAMCSLGERSLLVGTKDKQWVKNSPTHARYNRTCTVWIVSTPTETK